MGAWWRWHSLRARLINHNQTLPLHQYFCSITQKVMGRNVGELEIGNYRERTTSGSTRRKILYTQTHTHTHPRQHETRSCKCRLSYTRWVSKALVVRKTGGKKFVYINYAVKCLQMGFWCNLQLLSFAHKIFVFLVVTQYVDTVRSENDAYRHIKYL